MTERKWTIPEVRAKLEAEVKLAQDRLTATYAAQLTAPTVGQRAELAYRIEYRLGNLRGLEDVLELFDLLEMEP